MIDFLYHILAVLRQITREPVLLVLLIGWFFVARLIGKVTVRPTWPKILFALLLFPIIWPDLWSLSPVLIVIFFAGILSNHTETIKGMFSWSQGLGDMIFAIRHRLAYAEIRRLEEENEALKAQLRAAQMQDGGQSNTQQQWKQQARSWRSNGADGSTSQQADGGRASQGQSKPKGSRFSSSQGSTSSGSSSSGAGGQQQRSQRASASSGSSTQGSSSAQGQRRSQSQGASSKQTNNNGTSGQRQGASNAGAQGQSSSSLTVRDLHLQTLGLRPGQTYSSAEIKAAWRKRAKETHPDAGGSKAAFIAVVNAYNALK